ncbi:MAG: hypothetical protein AAF320_01130, partial [Myxococcota bacterium]
MQRLISRVQMLLQGRSAHVSVQARSMQQPRALSHASPWSNRSLLNKSAIRPEAWANQQQGFSTDFTPPNDGFSQQDSTYRKMSAAFAGATVTATLGYMYYQKHHQHTTQLPQPLGANDWNDVCEQHLQAAQKVVDNILAVSETRSLENTLRLYNEVDMHVIAAIDITRLLTYVHPDAAVRERAEKLHAQANALESRFLLNNKLYEAIKSVSPATLDAQSKRWLSKTLQKYRRAGVDEDEKTRERLTTLQREIAETEQTF